MSERLQLLRKCVTAVVLATCCAVFPALSGCGDTATPPTPPSAGQVYSYFGSPFVAVSLAPSISTFDHSLNQIGVSSLVSSSPTTQVPSSVLSGTFAAAPTGFLGITENFATSGSGLIAAQNPPLTGAWAVEIPGAGALVNLLSVNTSGSGLPVRTAPAAMTMNTSCPNFAQAAPFIYVAVPTAAGTNEVADYGGVTVSTQGSSVTFNAQPYLVGPVSQSATVVTGGCSQTIFGPVTAYPLNAFGAPANQELIAFAQSGLLVSSYPSGGTPGAFGTDSGVIGVSAPTGPVDIGSVVGAHYNGFSYAPQNGASANYDITMLASAFGDDTASSQACSALQSSLVANNGQGAETIAALPSANSIYGGEFLTATSSGAENDPTGANGSENCDMVIDLGTQDSTTNGLFPQATIFVGSNFPPFAEGKPWVCFGTNVTCAVSFPAAAVVGTVQGRYVIFVVASSATNPAAQLPNNLGSPIAQPLGIYLFQKSH
jgi:hypothetical protein